MTKKIAFLGGLCACAIFVNTACSTTKSSAMNTNQSSNDAKVVKTDQKLPVVAEPPQTPPARTTWGNNISPINE
jgi:hypothetical protein